MAGPHGCNCFSLLTWTRSWAIYSALCKGSAPLGYKGRLAFVPDEATFDILRSLNPNNDDAYIGLQPNVSSRSSSIVTSEWCWKEDGKCVKSWDFIPSAGLTTVMEQTSKCIKITNNGTFDDTNCVALRGYCEYYLGKVTNYKYMSYQL